MKRLGVRKDSKVGVAEDASRLTVIQFPSDLNSITKTTLEAFERDDVVLIKNVRQTDIDNIVYRISKLYGLETSLELQAGYGASLGHRSSVSKYYMSVNKRGDFQIVPPHSEGSSFASIELASFYCSENSTDGGETILMNTRQSCSSWKKVREQLVRCKMDRAPTSTEISQARAIYRLDLANDELQLDDEILREREISSELRLFDVLAKPSLTYSRIHNKDIFAYWDSIAATDFGSVPSTIHLLSEEGIYKKPRSCMDENALDWDTSRRVKDFGVNFNDLFSCKLTLKLDSGDLILLNNLTWTHSVNNWSPGSGTRIVMAAFA